MVEEGDERDVRGVLLDMARPRRHERHTAQASLLKQEIESLSRGELGDPMQADEKTFRDVVLGPFRYASTASRTVAGSPSKSLRSKFLSSDA